jgi:regulator of protease activity HflC (stomatin/prohibitin superfamily)
MEDENQIEARSSNGLAVFLDCTTLYTVNPAMASEIYTRVAPSVEELGSRIFTPIVRTVLRNAVSRYTSEELYSSRREEIQDAAQKELAAAVEAKGILVDRFLIRAIRLPADVDQAIQAKIAAQQEAEAMTYRREKAEREAEIKVIEARGLAESQEIINSTLTPNYLQHEAIQAYRELASKPSSTFVIMPTSPEATGMPLILGTGR